MWKDTLHMKAPGNWINDPNGFIYYRGEYHLFYQYFPYAPRWGTMHWGHAVSRDLVHWEHLGVALYPTKGYDQNGVFSGTALELDGKLCLYYSAVRYLRQDEEDIHIPPDDAFVTSQAMVISEDGRTFDNMGAKRQIIPVLADESLGDAKDTRDPKVWKQDGLYYMILGSTFRKEQGKALFYRSRDALHWEYVNQYTSPEFRTMLECPDLFPLGGGYVFLGSPMGVAPRESGYADHAMWSLADFDHDTCALSLKGPMECVDYGLDLYAPQTAIDREGRRVLIGWVRMPQTAADRANGTLRLYLNYRVRGVEDFSTQYKSSDLANYYYGGLTLFYKAYSLNNFISAWGGAEPQKVVVVAHENEYSTSLDDPQTKAVEYPVLTFEEYEASFTNN